MHAYFCVHVDIHIFAHWAAYLCKVEATYRGSSFLFKTVENNNNNEVVQETSLVTLLLAPL